MWCELLSVSRGLSFCANDKQGTNKSSCCRSFLRWFTIYEMCRLCTEIYECRPKGLEKRGGKKRVSRRDEDEDENVSVERRGCGVINIPRPGFRWNWNWNFFRGPFPSGQAPKTGG